jgi:hypothetical protein
VISGKAFPVIAIVTLASGCFAAPARRCPSCRLIDGRAATLPPLNAGTTRLFILVPGTLGYGWEWDRPVERLRATPGVELAVFVWDGWSSLERAARELTAVLERAQLVAPPSLREIVVLAHSGGGVVAAYAVGQLPPPRVSLTLVTIGAPFAGMHICPCSESDLKHAPLMLSLSTRFSRYPAPAPGVKVIEYVTAYPGDPVMHPYWGESAAPEGIGPPGARRIMLDPRLDHSNGVDLAVIDMLHTEKGTRVAK